MRFADWFRGVENVLTAAVHEVFGTARMAVANAPLPANIKTDLVQLLNDGEGDLTGLEALAGTLVGNVVADGIDDLTTLLLNTRNALTNSKSVADFSAAEKTAFIQAWAAMKAQGDTLAAQFMAGVDPSAPRTTVGVAALNSAVSG